MPTNCNDHGACPSTALSLKEIEQLMTTINSQWQFKDKAISRELEFDSYQAGLNFVNQIAALAEKQNHHPDLFLTYKKVRVSYWTHNADGLTEMDFAAAREVDLIQQLNQ